ncbi:MAG: SRPBCC family protein [Psychrobium sp.]
MKVLRVVFWIFVAMFILGVFMPQDYKIGRSIEINSSLDKAFTLSNDLNEWKRWSPWAQLDNSVKVEVGEISSGVGASQSWRDDSGGGRLTFIESVPNQRISYNIWFGDAKHPAISSMTFEQVTANTIRVHWTIEGDMQMHVIGPWFALLMDTLVGPAFELGLENLKTEAEK